MYTRILYSRYIGPLQCFSLISHKRANQARATITKELQYNYADHSLITRIQFSTKKGDGSYVSGFARASSLYEIDI